MVDFSTFGPEDGLPIYLQIIRHVKRAIAAGTVQAGDELPSRRVLSAQLVTLPLYPRWRQQRRDPGDHLVPAGGSKHSGLLGHRGRG